MSRTLHTRLAPLCLTLVCATAASPALAQDPPAQESADEPAQVLVLGTYHFANPGLDVVKTEVTDVLGEARQTEIEGVVDALARFRPTRIAVECLPSARAALDGDYDAFLAGERELGRDETQQLGFRLAARLDHPRLYPIDYRSDFPFGAMMEYAEGHDPEFVDSVRAELARIAEESEREQRELTVAGILRAHNDPVNLARGHAMYLRFARVGADDTGVGADLLAKWYERNVHIFSRIQSVAEPGERVLVIIGSGHAPILRDLIAADPTLRLADTLAFLPGA